MKTAKQVPYPTLDTPAALLDLDKLEANIAEMSRLARESNLRLRPHIKIHESTAIARMQIAAGAVGIEVGSLDQVEPMADAGIEDILVAHPFQGVRKFEKMAELLRRPNLKLTFVVDMLEHARAISDVASSVGRRVPVVIKLETGGNRLGVPPDENVYELAKSLLALPAIDFKGVYAHEVYSGPTKEGAEQEALKVARLTVETARMLREKGLTVDHVSVGASPTFSATCRYVKQGKFREITEIHPGKLVVDDISQAMMLDSEQPRRAISVLASVISTSHQGHAVIDAGFKTFGFDALLGYRDRPDFFWQGKPSFGLVKGRPDLWFGALHAEVGRIFYKNPARRLNLGERIEILPNNTTLVIRLHDKLHGVRNGAVERVIAVRGKD